MINNSLTVLFNQIIPSNKIQAAGCNKIWKIEGGFQGKVQDQTTKSKTDYDIIFKFPSFTAAQVIHNFSTPFFLEGSCV